MKLVLSIIALCVNVALGEVNSDSLSMRLSLLPYHIHGHDSIALPALHLRIGSDGVTIGNTKYFIRVLKPDPSIDYRMLKIVPRGGGVPEFHRRPFTHPGEKFKWFQPLPRK